MYRVSDSDRQYELDWHHLQRHFAHCHEVVALATIAALCPHTVGTWRKVVQISVHEMHLSRGCTI